MNQIDLRDGWHGGYGRGWGGDRYNGDVCGVDIVFMRSY